MKRPKRKTKTRERGGASHPCPKCGGPSHVLVTRRRDSSVERHRECLKCGRPFHTREEHAVENRA